MRMPTVTIVKVSGLGDGDDLVLPHDHISPAPGLTALVNCVRRQSKNTQNNVHDSRNNRSLYMSISRYLGPPVF